MSDRPLVDLVLAATKLKGASPQFYGELVEAFRSLEIQAITDMVSSDQPHEMFRTQGRVKTIQQIRKHLVDCQQLRDTFVRRETNARPVQP